MLTLKVPFAYFLQLVATKDLLPGHGCVNDLGFIGFRVGVYHDANYPTLLRICMRKSYEEPSKRVGLIDFGRIQVGFKVSPYKP